MIALFRATLCSPVTYYLTGQFPCWQRRRLSCGTCRCAWPMWSTLKRGLWTWSARSNQPTQLRWWETRQKTGPRSHRHLPAVTNQKKTFFVNAQKMVSFVTAWPLRIGWFSTPTESQWWWVCRKKSSPRPHLLQNVWRQVLGRWWGHGLAWWCFLSEGPTTIKDLTILLQHFKSLRYVIEEYW